MARLGCYKPPGDLWVKIVESAVINIEVVNRESRLNREHSDFICNTLTLKATLSK